MHPPTVAVAHTCAHSDRFTIGDIEWPTKGDHWTLPPKENMLSMENGADDMQPIIQSMDDTLFFEDKTGWHECQVKMSLHYAEFTWARMGTHSNHRAIATVCNQCGKGLAVATDKSNTAEYKKLMRLQWLSFWDCEFTEPGSSEARER